MGWDRGLYWVNRTWSRTWSRTWDGTGNMTRITTYVLGRLNGNGCHTIGAHCLFYESLTSDGLQKSNKYQNIMKIIGYL